MQYLAHTGNTHIYGQVRYQVLDLVLREEEKQVVGRCVQELGW